MIATNLFKELEQSVRKVLVQSTTNREIIENLKPAFQSLINQPGLVPINYQKPLPDKYGQYLLYKPDDDLFSIVAFVWGPGQGAPIHDHLVWGLVGVYEGAIEEKRYQKITNRENADRFKLHHVDTVVAEKNMITFVYPPNADIHSVSNPFDKQAITIHLYGTDIGKQPRNRYQPDKNEIKAMITPHVNNTAIYK